MTSPQPRTSSATTPAAPSAASTPSPSAIADCPATVRNAAGHYSFTCPAGWKFINCEGSSFYSPYTWLVNPQQPCRQETYGARLFVISFAGAHEPPGYLGSLQSSQNVAVAGVAGTRKVYLVTASNPLPPPRDTVQILYTFARQGRIYYLENDRYPGDSDLTQDFDRMVTQTLTFLA
jgi:hypothetical protein